MEYYIQMRSLFSVYALFFLLHAAGATAGEPVPVSYICIEVETGMVLMESNADLQRPPASMLKMMQMLLVEEGILAGKWGYDKIIEVSKLSQSMGGTQAYLKEGESWPLQTLLTAIAVISANDAAVAVAEGLWGSVENCLLAMNNRASELGMTKTHFYSVNGLPPNDGKTFDLTTARDMATLGRALLQYPDILNFTSTKEFALRPENAPKANTNQLLVTLPGCDGLKTGYIRAAGFCLTATAKRNDIRLIAVVMGSDKRGRFTHTQSLLEQGFPMVQRVQPVQAGLQIGKTIPVNKSLDNSTPLVARDSITAIVRTAQLNSLTLEITAPTSLTAPIAANSVNGQVRLMLGDQELGRSALIVDHAVEKARLTDYGIGCMGRKE